MKRNNPSQPGQPPANSWIEDGWIDSLELEALLHISTRTLSRWRQNGLRYSKAGARIYYLKSSVHEFLLSKEAGPKRK